MAVEGFKTDRFKTGKLSKKVSGGYKNKLLDQYIPQEYWKRGEIYFKMKPEQFTDKTMEEVSDTAEGHRTPAPTS